MDREVRSHSAISLENSIAKLPAANDREPGARASLGSALAGVTTRLRAGSMIKPWRGVIPVLFRRRFRGRGTRIPKCAALRPSLAGAPSDSLSVITGEKGPVSPGPSAPFVRPSVGREPFFHRRPRGAFVVGNLGVTARYSPPVPLAGDSSNVDDEAGRVDLPKAPGRGAVGTPVAPRNCIVRGKITRRRSSSVRGRSAFLRRRAERPRCIRGC